MLSGLRAAFGSGQVSGDALCVRVGGMGKYGGHSALDRLLGATIDDHFGTGLRQRLGNGQTNTCGGAGDNGGFFCRSIASMENSLGVRGVHQTSRSGGR